MQTYTLSDARNHHGEVFDHATYEPVLLTKKLRPSHVILSARLFDELIERVDTLEDQLLGNSAVEASKLSKFVGSDIFTSEIKKLANANP